MTNLRIAGAQLPVTNNIASNVVEISRAIAFARDTHADILLTPEGALSGYTHTFDVEAVKAGLREVAAQAREAGIGLALGTCFVEDDGLCYNQIRFYAANGAFLGFHSKTLRCGTLTSSTKGEIEHYAVQPLRTYTVKGITVGGLICNDLWANPECTPMPDPHLTQQLSKMGVRVIFHAVNGGRDGSDWSSNVNWRYHEANLRMRARAGGVWIITVDSSHPVNLQCSAPSGVVNPQGEWVCRAPDRDEQFFVYDIEI